MRKRTLARQIALKALYMLDLRGPSALAEVPALVRTMTPDTEIADFAVSLIQETYRNIETLDERISAAAENWQIGRMAAVDRNILRMALYELTFMDDVPYKVTLNEAIELAKTFSTNNSGAFVNGILDNLRKKIAGE